MKLFVELSYVAINFNLECKTKFINLAQINFGNKCL